MAEFVLLDRDGVLNIDLPGSVLRLEDLKLLPGIPEAIAILRRKGYRLLVITNQACVGRQELEPEVLREMHLWIEDQVTGPDGGIEDWFICTHSASEGCDCRKPLPGLIRQALSRYGFDPSVTRMVGDAGRDLEAAQAAGCVPILVRTGKGAETSAEYPEVECHEDLLAFARLVPNAKGSQS